MFAETTDVQRRQLQGGKRETEVVLDWVAEGGNGAAWSSFVRTPLCLLCGKGDAQETAVEWAVIISGRDQLLAVTVVGWRRCDGLG